MRKRNRVSWIVLCDSWEEKINITEAKINTGRWGQRPLQVPIGIIVGGESRRPVCFFIKYQQRFFVVGDGDLDIP